MRATAEDLVGFLNREAQALESLAALPRNALRGHVRDRLAEGFGFPFQVTLRCLVVGERLMDAIPLADGTRAPVDAPRFLELVPEGLTREAAALSGPLLVPCARPLQPGSVVKADLVLDDPTRHDLPVPGLLARLERLDAVVAVEP